MATKKIEYEDKVDLQIWGSVPDKNKVKAEDMNEIKDVVNNNEKELVGTQTKLEKVEKEFNDYAIHGQASGEFIHLTDSAKSSCKIDIKGNVKQDGEPTLDAPAEIQTVKDSVKVTSCNENLLDNILNNHEINGVKVVVNSDKSLTLNGTSTANIILNVGVVKLKPNTYCMSGSPEGSSYTTYFLDVGSDGKDYGNGFSFIVDEETVVTARLAVRAGVTLNNLKFCPKIEIGSVETPYKTHEQNSVTVSIQQEMLTKDYLDKTNKKEVHFWDKLKVKDKISRIIKRQAENRTSFNYTVENVKPNTWTVIKNNAICNRFVQVSPYVVEKSNCFSVWNGDNVITITIDNSYLKDVSSDEKILESWNELLNKWESEGEPLELFYERQDSKEIDLTQKQIEALKKTDEMQTYKNITNITTDSIAILDVDYKKDLETWQKQQDDRITALEELLSTTQTSAMLVENLENDLLKEVE